MAVLTAQGTIWNLPNYSGELFTAKQNTTFLSFLGGLGGFSRTVKSAVFQMGSEIEASTEAQPDISETQSLTASSYYTMFPRSQETNTVQIFQRAIALSYEKMANEETMSGLNLAGDANNAPNELDFQIAQNLANMARDVEYSFLNGTYEAATDAASANRTRGIITACASGNTVAASSATLSKALVESLLQTMFTAGADFENPVIWVNAFQKRKLSEIYGYAPTDRMAGGVAIDQIYTDFGVMRVMLNSRVPAATLLISDMAKVRPVGKNVAGKGNFFVEELAKTGASDNYQLFGYAGIDYTSDTYHGTITGLATS